MSQRPTGVAEPLPLVILRPGQAPVRQGEPCVGLWRVQSGVLRASHVTDHGRELWVDVLGPGDVVGDHAQIEAVWTVTALRPTRLLATHPRRELDALARRTARLAAAASDLAWLDVPTRIDRKLRDLAGRIGTPVSGGTLIPIDLSQDDIAALSGTTRESANRAVTSLIATGRLARPRRGRYVVRPPMRPVDP
jgi:CRP/FNR family transcriptional regulator/CRP/FNR family cyclic AMP-dependent transcriptional regulator